MDKKYCLCCGKEIKEGLWHEKCIKSFFGTSSIPEISIKEEDIKKLAITQLEKSSTIAGVQEKLSLHLDLEQKRRPRLTIIGFPSGYILKPQTEEHYHLPEFEHTAMLMAEECGLSVVPHALIEINEDKELAYITKRIDRNGSNKIHMEDFAQATLTTTENKYRSSYEECMNLIDKYSHNPALDKVNLFRCLYFCFVIGNSDVHLKNFSFIMDNDGKLRLSEFYDLLPTKIIMPDDHEELGMRFNGKKKMLFKQDFYTFAFNTGIDNKVADNIIKYINNKKDAMIDVINKSNLNQIEKNSWIKLISSNIKRP